MIPGTDRRERPAPSRRLTRRAFATPGRAFTSASSVQICRPGHHWAPLSTADGGVVSEFFQWFPLPGGVDGRCAV